MLSENHYEKHNYTILGIGNTGEYVIENISASFGARAPLSFHTCKKFSDLRMEDITYTEKTKALFLVLQPGDGTCDKFIPEIESFRNSTGIPIYTIANYPFLWEGRIRIALADDLLQDLIRISHGTFRIESHQWFPLKEQLGFHRVVDLVYDVAARVLLSIMKLKAQDMDIEEMENISKDENVEAIKQNGECWIVKLCDPDILNLHWINGDINSLDNCREITPDMRALGSDSKIPKKRILFVCTVNLMRSATAHTIYSYDLRFEVKSAGTHRSAETVLSEELLDWSDTVVVMEDRHMNFIRKTYPEIYKVKNIVCLYVSDNYDYMQAELITLLRVNFEDAYRSGLI